MKTKEFIKAVKKLGYYPLGNNAIIKIMKSQTIPLVYADVATKHRNALQTDYFPFTELTSEKQAELLDALIEYARTPIEEREEEPRYRLRHKCLNSPCYLNYDQASKGFYFGDDESAPCVHIDGTSKEWEERTGRTWAQLMQEFDKEVVE